MSEEYKAAFQEVILALESVSHKLERSFLDEHYPCCAGADVVQKTILAFIDSTDSKRKGKK